MVGGEQGRTPRVEFLTFGGRGGGERETKTDLAKPSSLLRFFQPRDKRSKGIRLMK